MTPEQNQWLEGLVCQRISEDEHNDDLRLDFESSKVNSLNDFIAGPHTMDIDRDGDKAVYVIKDGEQIIAFFTIQCGMVFEQILSDEEHTFYNCFKDRQQKKISERDKEWLMEYQATHNLTDLDMHRLYETIEERIQAVRPKKNDDKRFEKTPDVTLVDKTFPAVEIVHFCKNEKYSGAFDRIFPGSRLGEILFMKKIVPTLAAVQRVAGCQFVYLFAVTNERDEKLVAHYRRLGFQTNPGHGVYKSLHSSGCVFMSQPLNKLIQQSGQYTVDTLAFDD